MKEICKANSSIRHLHKINVNYPKTVRPSKLSLHLITILVNIKDKENNIKQKNGI